MASARIGALRVDLGMNTAAFEKGATLAERRMNKLSGNMNKLGKKLSSLGKTMSIGITAPLAAFGVSAFKAATDAQEMESAFDVVFGNMAEGMRKWAVATGDAMGRSTQEIQRGAMAFQELFGKALDPAKAAEMSKQFAVLTQDLASFKNLSNEVAQQKLFSGLTGEAEPLRAVGVFINDAAVQAKALEMGLEKVNGKYTDQSKILARAALIQEQLSAAQGDVMRTSDSTANQLKNTAAAFEELQVVIGTKLLPVITPLIEKLAKMLEWFSRLPDPVQNTVLVVGALSAAMGPVLMAVGALIPLLVKLAPLLLHLPKLLTAVGVAFRFMLGPIGLAITAIGAVYYAWKNWEQIEPIVRRMVLGVKAWIQDKLASILETAIKPIRTVKNAFFDLYDAVVGHSYIPDMVDGIAAQMARLDAVMVDPAARAARKTADVMREMAGEVRSILDRLFPEQAALASYRKDKAAIAGSDLSDAQKAEAYKRLGLELSSATASGRWNPFPNQDLSAEELGTAGMERAARDWERIVGRISDKAEETRVRVVKSFKDMAEDTMRAMQNLASAIKGGGFLDILSAVIGMGMQLASVGAFGKKIQGNVNASFGGARAAGGPVSFGKSYLVGENGPEMFTPNSSGAIVPNHALGGGGTYIFKGNLMTPEFWAQIQAGDIMAANAGGEIGMARSRYRQSRRVA